jgi:hypothetical protein
VELKRILVHFKWTFRGLLVKLLDVVDFQRTQWTFSGLLVDLVDLADFVDFVDFVDFLWT